MNSIYKNFVQCARGLGSFIVGQKEDVPYDITELMNGYCEAKDAEDQTKMNQYISALFVRYWHMVVYLYNTSTSTRLEFEDIVSWMYDSFEKAAKYRSWLDPNKAVSKDPKGAEKCINQCITSTRQFWYKHFNQDKRKINFITSSLDDSIPNRGSDDVPTTVLDTIADDESNELIKVGHDIIQKYIYENKIYEALVLDGILYQDCFVDSTSTEVTGVDENGKNVEVTKYSSQFSSIKLNKHLKSIDNKFIKYFTKEYDIEESALQETIDYMHSYSRQTAVKKLEKALETFRKDKEILNWLCM